MDTSVIVPALLAPHEHHAAALPVVQRALTEAFAVLTRLPPPWRLRPEDAHRLLAETFRGNARVVGLDGDQAWTLLDEALAHRVSGGALYDAHIVACAKQAKAARLATFNRRHFERLDLGDVALLPTAD